MVCGSLQKEVRNGVSLHIDFFQLAGCSIDVLLNGLRQTAAEVESGAVAVPCEQASLVPVV